MPSVEPMAFCTTCGSRKEECGCESRHLAKRFREEEGFDDFLNSVITKAVDQSDKKWAERVEASDQKWASRAQELLAESAKVTDVKIEAACCPHRAA